MGADEYLRGILEVENEAVLSSVAAERCRGKMGEL